MRRCGWRAACEVTAERAARAVIVAGGQRSGQGGVVEEAVKARMARVVET